MNIRIKFCKTGSLRFISHLDLMRYFQKVLRRAEIDICYSEGFSPHMIMSFASPLGLGLTSRGEYVDIRVHKAPSSAEALERMNAVTVEGMEVLRFRRLPEQSKNAMSIVAAADYEVRFREEQKLPEEWAEKLTKYLEQPAICIQKETKKGKQEVDIRPWIYACSVREGVIDMQLSAGSVHNLKPELLMQSFGEWAGFAVPASALLIHRTELYADLGTETKRKLVPLEELGEDIG